MLDKNEKKLLVIPWNLIKRVLSMYHNEASAAHLSRDRLYDHLRNRFYWYGMYTSRRCQPMNESAFLMYRRNPILPQDSRVAGISLNQRHVAAPTLQAYKTNLVHTLQQAHNAADIAKRKEQEHYREYYKKTQKGVLYSPGDHVIRHVPGPKVGVNYKLAPHWDGPYTVEAESGDVSHARKMVQLNANVRELRPATE
jgi:hypothetical protein